MPICDYLARDIRSGLDVHLGREDHREIQLGYLTRSILLQIILEEETAGVPIFTEQVLANIIRFYGHAMQDFMGSYLEKNVQIFMDLQHKMTEQSTGVNPEAWKQFMNVQSPMMQGMMGTYLEQSRNAFTQMQEQMQKNSEQMLAALGLKR